MFRTVSIIPGMENFAPERTDTSSGSSGSPSFFPRVSSRVARWAATWSSNPAGTVPASRYARHASVEIVKPGGTGSPSLTISARFAPFPPNRSFWSLSPSEKSKTYFVVCAGSVVVIGVAPRSARRGAQGSGVAGRDRRTGWCRSDQCDGRKPC